MLVRLKMLRREKGITQKKLAEIVGTTQQSINKYENHNIEPDISTLITMADYFNISVDYRIGHSESRQTEELTELQQLYICETSRLEGYRKLNDKEKESIRLIIENYNSK